VLRVRFGGWKVIVPAAARVHAAGGGAPELLAELRRLHGLGHLNSKYGTLASGDRSSPAAGLGAATKSTAFQGAPVARRPPGVQVLPDDTAAFEG
jgi:hypothetical protein